MGDAKSPPHKRRPSRGGGPRSAAGRQRVRQNARRHGLAAAALPGSMRAQREGQLARLFAALYQQAADAVPVVRAAEAAAQLVEIRELRCRMIEQALFDPESYHELSPARRLQRLDKLIDALDAEDDARIEKLSRGLFPVVPDDAVERLARSLIHLAEDLQRLERYERRALSARKTALRRLEQLRKDI